VDSQTQTGDEPVSPQAMTAPAMRKSIGFLLRLAYQRNQALFQRHCVDAALTSVQMAVLHVLADKKASSLKELRRLTAMDPATTTGVVERLAAHALITLAPDPADRRRRIAKLSPKGRALVKRMMPALETISSATLEPLSVDERVMLIALLERVGESDKPDTEDEAD
jgi:DNA-binding MarR family transcriptional regulator